MFRKALASLDDDEAPEAEDESVLEVPFVAAGHQNYIHEITQLVAASYELINTFDRLLKEENKIPNSRLENMKGDFLKDREAVLSTIEAGRRVAARDIQTMLSDRHNEVRGRSNLTREDEQKGRILLSKGEDDNKENHEAVGWGNVAADARKAVHKLEKVGQPRHLE